MAQISQEEAVRLLCEVLGVEEGPEFVLACDRVLSGWRIQRIVSNPLDYVGLRPWVVSDEGSVATIPFGSSATDVLRALDTAEP